MSLRCQENGSHVECAHQCDGIEPGKLNQSGVILSTCPECGHIVDLGFRSLMPTTRGPSFRTVFYVDVSYHWNDAGRMVFRIGDGAL